MVYLPATPSLLTIQERPNKGIEDNGWIVSCSADTTLSAIALKKTGIVLVFHDFMCLATSNGIFFFLFFLLLVLLVIYYILLLRSHSYLYLLYTLPNSNTKNNP